MCYRQFAQQQDTILVKFIEIKKKLDAMKDAPPSPSPAPTRIFKVLKFYTIELPKIKIISHTSDFFFGSTHVYVSNSFAAVTQCNADWNYDVLTDLLGVFFLPKI